MDQYLKKQAGQDIRRCFAACYVAVMDSGDIAGYYTLSSASVAMSDMPEQTAKRLPRYQNVPFTLLGRLAVGLAYQNQGLGAILLNDAYERVKRSEIASYALLVEAKDESAGNFYKKHGFLSLPNMSQKMFLPLV